jgi:nicotinamidase-related amidase
VGDGVTVEQANPALSLLTPDRAVLLLVDLQERLLPAIEGQEGLLRNVCLLVRLASEMGLPVVLTTQYRKGLGEVTPRVRSLLPDIEALDKTSFGCFQDQGFVSQMAMLSGRDQILLAGVETHICVCQTALGALEKSYSVHLISDAVGARTAANQRIGLARMERAGALVSSAEMATYELLGRADSELFRRMLPHLKS